MDCEWLRDDQLLFLTDSGQVVLYHNGSLVSLFEFESAKKYDNILVDWDNDKLWFSYENIVDRDVYKRQELHHNAVGLDDRQPRILAGVQLFSQFLQLQEKMCTEGVDWLPGSAKPSGGLSFVYAIF